MSKLFEIPAAVMPMALAASAKGEKDLAQFASAAEGILGVKAAIFLSAFQGIRVEAERSEAVKVIEAAAAGYSVPNGMLKVLKMGVDFTTKYTIAEQKDGETVKVAGYTPRLTFMVEMAEDGTASLKVNAGSIGVRASKGGTKADSSRISAFEAWKRGVKGGDTFKVVKDGKSYKVDGRIVPGRKNGGLTGFILKVHPNSKTAAILKDYGNSLD